MQWPILCHDSRPKENAAINAATPMGDLMYAIEGQNGSANACSQ